MRLPIGLPLIIKDVRIVGPKRSIAVDLLFDTGSAFVTLPRSVIKLIGYDLIVASEPQEIVTANGIIEVPKLKVDKVIIGNMKAQEVEVICHDIPFAGVRGLLGLSFIKQFRTVIDYKQNYFEIS